MQILSFVVTVPCECIYFLAIIIVVSYIDEQMMESITISTDGKQKMKIK